MISKQLRPISICATALSLLALIFCAIFWYMEESNRPAMEALAPFAGITLLVGIFLLFAAPKIEELLAEDYDDDEDDLP